MCTVLIVVCALIGVLVPDLPDFSDPLLVSTVSLHSTFHGTFFFKLKTEYTGRTFNSFVFFFLILKGFEPRGTAIGQRLVTWNNMVKNTGYKATLANYPFKYADEQAKK